MTRVHVARGKNISIAAERNNSRSNVIPVKSLTDVYKWFNRGSLSRPWMTCLDFPCDYTMLRILFRVS